MRLCEQLLELCDDFTIEITNEEQNEVLANAIQSLSNFLEAEVDGWTRTPSDEFAYAVRSRAEEIFELVSEDEKKNNHHLTDYFEELVNTLDQIQDDIDANVESQSYDDESDYKYDEDLAECDDFSEESQA